MKGQIALRTSAALGWKNLNPLLRVLPVPVTNLLDEWLESEALKRARS